MRQPPARRLTTRSGVRRYASGIGSSKSIGVVRRTVRQTVRLSETLRSPAGVLGDDFVG